MLVCKYAIKNSKDLYASTGSIVKLLLNSGWSEEFEIKNVDGFLGVINFKDDTSIEVSKVKDFEVIYK